MQATSTRGKPFGNRLPSDDEPQGLSYPSKLESALQEILSKRTEDNRGNGRPHGITKEKCEAIIKCLEMGMTQKDAAGAAGISYETLRMWKKEFPVFSAEVAYSKGRAIKRCYEFLWHHAEHKDWRAARYILQISDPYRFGNKELGRMPTTPQPVEIIFNRDQQDDSNESSWNVS